MINFDQIRITNQKSKESLNPSFNEELNNLKKNANPYSGGSREERRVKRTAATGRGVCKRRKTEAGEQARTVAEIERDVESNVEAEFPTPPLSSSSSSPVPSSVSPVPVPSHPTSPLSSTSSPVPSTVSPVPVPSHPTSPIRQSSVCPSPPIPTPLMLPVIPTISLIPFMPIFPQFFPFAYPFNPFFPFIPPSKP
uniref:BZIP domain-containing protein n=1 Tax=Caenorhabditis tropicalis TaxID=1561998 RepID=A0A1I7UD88_9PELO